MIDSRVRIIQSDVKRSHSIRYYRSRSTRAKFQVQKYVHKTVFYNGETLRKQNTIVIDLLKTVSLFILLSNEYPKIELFF